MMPWLKIDDQIFLHPKIVAAGKDATLLHLSALAYASSQLTDGFIPSAAIRIIAATVNVPAKGAVRLVDAGLWEVVEGGYAIHDFLQYNPSKEETLAKRSELSEKRAEAGRKGANKRWHDDSKPIAKPMANGTQTDDPHPHPQSPELRPSPEQGIKQQNTVIKPLATDEPPRVKTPRPRNALFDALMLACDYDMAAPLTAQESARIGKAAADIKSAQGTAEDVPIRAVRYQAKYPHASLTPLAIAGHWGELSVDPAPRAPPTNGAANAETFAERQERLSQEALDRVVPQIREYRNGRSDVSTGNAESHGRLSARVRPD